LVLTAALAGCASTKIASTPMRSYTIGQTLRAPVGGVLLSAQTGQIETIRRWVGILNSPDGWAVTAQPSLDYVKKELIYSGAVGPTIELGYREYRGGLAAPAFYQSVKYDLSQSRVVTFQNFQIEVNSADNSEMTGRLLRD
ncbi:MAG: hypothetical protein ACRDH2_20445, partial [Anaerolineales bacterium]